jgi:chaperonin cofactor prefoldin
MRSNAPITLSLMIALSCLSGCPPKEQQPNQLELFTNRVRSLHVEPHPAFRPAQAGSVYVARDLDNPYPPQDVFTNTELVTEKRAEIVNGNYTGATYAGGELNVPVLEWLGLTASAQASTASVLQVIVPNLFVANMRKDQFERASVKPEFRARLDRLHSLVALTRVAYVDELKLTFFNDARLRVELSDDTVQLLNLRLAGENLTSSQEHFPEFVVGSKPVFRAGGEGSAMTPELARVLVERMKDAQIVDAEVVNGTTVVAPLTWAQVLPVYHLAGALLEVHQQAAQIAEVETRLASAHAALEQADASSRRYETRLASVQTSIQQKETAVRQLEVDVASATREVQSLEERLTSVRDRVNQQSERLEEEMRQLKRRLIDELAVRDDREINGAMDRIEALLQEIRDTVRAE